MDGWVPGGGGGTLFTHNIRSLGLFWRFKILNFNIFIIIIIFFFFFFFFFFFWGWGGGGGGGVSKINILCGYEEVVDIFEAS